MIHLNTTRTIVRKYDWIPFLNQSSCTKSVVLGLLLIHSQRHSFEDESMIIYHAIDGHRSLLLPSFLDHDKQHTSYCQYLCKNSQEANRTMSGIDYCFVNSCRYDNISIGRCLPLCLHDYNDQRRIGCSLADSFIYLFHDSVLQVNMILAGMALTSFRVKVKFNHE
jgi:hypothetical protein